MKRLDYNTPKFLGDFSSMNSTQVRGWMVAQFEVSETEVEKYQVLAGCLDDGSWDSAVWFLLRDRNSVGLFEVHGSHCSCYGYEEQFSPEPTDLKYLLSDKFSISCFSNLVPEFVAFFKTI